MSTIKNGGFDKYGAEPFKQQQLGPAGVEGVKQCNCLSSLSILLAEQTALVCRLDNVTLRCHCYVFLMVMPRCQSCSAVFNDFAAPLRDLSCGPGADPEFLVSDTGQIFKIFWLRIVHFGLVWLWHIIRQSRIHLNILEVFYVRSWRLARSAAHSQLGPKHGTVIL